MRVFALSDIHVDYAENLAWIMALSDSDYQDDVLLLAGDVTDDMGLLRTVLTQLRACFKGVYFVPGNHDLWVRKEGYSCSLQKFADIQSLCAELDVKTRISTVENLLIVPLLGWYDFSFAEPDRYLRRAWRDFRACQWPETLQDEQAITDYFLSLNQLPDEGVRSSSRIDATISFSHFLPRLDVMPERIPPHKRRVYPVLGSVKLGAQVAQLVPDVHVYGHSHVNRAVTLDATRYVNNAFAYPDEERIARKTLVCVWDSGEGIAC